MHINLVVLRTAEMPMLVKFYSALGLVFEYHRHGKSPLHYCAKAGETVIEIYPLAKDQTHADKNLRLGFVIDNFDEAINLLRDNVVSPRNLGLGVIWRYCKTRTEERLRFINSSVKIKRRGNISVKLPSYVPTVEEYDPEKNRDWLHKSQIHIPMPGTRNLHG